MKCKQVDNVKRKKLSCNAVYILFFVYNIDIDIHYINISLLYNNTSITLKC